MIVVPDEQAQLTSEANRIRPTATAIGICSSRHRLYTRRPIVGAKHP